MPLAVMQDEATDPGNVLLLGPVAVVLCAELVPQLFEKPGFASMPYNFPVPFDAYHRLWFICVISLRGGLISGSLPQFPYGALPATYSWAAGACARRTTRVRRFEEIKR
jgi:hypothetical protein